MDDKDTSKDDVILRVINPFRLINGGNDQTYFRFPRRQVMECGLPIMVDNDDFVRMAELDAQGLDHEYNANGTVSFFQTKYVSEAEVMYLKRVICELENGRKYYF